MDWKDTVMDKILIDASDGLASKKKIKEIRGLLEQQAEISFKAGYESGWNDNKPYLPDANEPWDREKTVFEDGKQAGIRKVVEWVKTNDDSGVTCTIKLNPEEWQAKLKEWGINEALHYKTHKC